MKEDTEVNKKINKKKIKKKKYRKRFGKSYKVINGKKIKLYRILNI